MVVAAPGLYHPNASAVILAHHDLEAAGLRVDYSQGTATTATGESIAMHKQGNVWVMPLDESPTKPEKCDENVSMALLSLEDKWILESIS